MQRSIQSLVLDTPYDWISILHFTPWQTVHSNTISTALRSTNCTHISLMVSQCSFFLGFFHYYIASNWWQKTLSVFLMS